MDSASDANREVKSAEDEMAGWIGRHLRRASNAVLQHLNREFEPYDFRVSLFSVMRMIHSYPGVSGARLSEYLAVPRSNMVVLLRELEARGLVERGEGPGKGRAQAFRLSRQGESRMRELDEAHARHDRYLDTKLSAKDRQTLIALLQRLWQDKDDAPE